MPLESDIYIIYYILYIRGENRNPPTIHPETETLAQLHLTNQLLIQSDRTKMPHFGFHYHSRSKPISIALPPIFIQFTWKLE